MGAEATKLGQLCVNSLNSRHVEISPVANCMWDLIKFEGPTLLMTFGGESMAWTCSVQGLLGDICLPKQKQKTWHVNVSANGTCAQEIQG